MVIMAITGVFERVLEHKKEGPKEPVKIPQDLQLGHYSLHKVCIMRGM